MRISIEVDESTSKEELVFALEHLAAAVKQCPNINDKSMNWRPAGNWFSSVSGHRFTSFDVPISGDVPASYCACDIRIGPLLRKIGFAPVYLTEGRLWLSQGEITCLRETTEKACRDVAARLPDWARANVLQRVSEVEIREL